MLIWFSTTIELRVFSLSGESAFKTMTKSFGWAKRPMIQRIHELDHSIPLTMIYGSRSWMDISIGDKVRELRPYSYVDVKQIDKAGHHIYSDKSEEFNQIVTEVCNRVHLDLQQQWNFNRVVDINVVDGTVFVRLSMWLCDCYTVSVQRTLFVWQLTKYYDMNIVVFIINKVECYMAMKQGLIIVYPKAWPLACGRGANAWHGRRVTPECKAGSGTL